MSGEPREEPASGGRQPAEPATDGEPPNRAIGVLEYLFLFQILSTTFQFSWRAALDPEFDYRSTFEVRRELEAAVATTVMVNAFAVPLAWEAGRDSDRFRVAWVGRPRWIWAAVAVAVVAFGGGVIGGIAWFAVQFIIYGRL